jgi:hypothetical protein
MQRWTKRSRPRSSFMIGTSCFDRNVDLVIAGVTGGA